MKDVINQCLEFDCSADQLDSALRVVLDSALRVALVSALRVALVSALREVLVSALRAVLGSTYWPVVHLSSQSLLH